MKKVKGKKKITIRQHILIPISCLVVVETVLLMGGLLTSGITKRLNQNAYDILQERVINRSNYLENEMIDTWSSLSGPMDKINTKTQQLINEQKITISSLDDGSKQSEPLLLSVSEEIIDIIRNNHVNGAFIVLNTEDLDGTLQDKPGLCIRDLDPTSTVSEKNTDLLIERAPAALIQQLDISADTAWAPLFEFNQRNVDYYSFLYEPYQQAIHSNGKYNVEDLGYWSRPYHIYGDNNTYISYSMPLILEDGTVYGVLGVEISYQYLQKMLPYQELVDDKQGNYVLAIGNAKNNEYTTVFQSGMTYKNLDSNATFLVEPNTNGYYLKADSTYYCAMEPLDLYDRNTPFSNQEWQVMAIVKNSTLLSFTNGISTALIFIVLLTIIVGFIGTIFVSYFISKPILVLSKELNGASKGTIPELSQTNIKEIDQLATSVQQLNRNVMEASSKFTKIIQMASTEIAGFMLNWQENEIFLTDDLFKMFGDDVEDKVLTVDMFTTHFKKFDQYATPVLYQEDVYVYKVVINGQDKFIKLSITNEETCCYGLAEDITASMKERKAIEYERDHDLLTGLMNGRSFKRMVAELFAQGPKVLKVAALIMMDLDNLKNINDTFGHDCGDAYIKRAADAFLKYAPDNAIVARISGDEFNILMYGYNSKEEAREAILNLRIGIDTTIVHLPNQHSSKVHVSSGVSWYPDDSTAFEELQRYSDYAMYKVKNSTKGEFSDFDRSNYNDYTYSVKSKAEFTRLLEQEAITHYFQPIIDIQTGEVFAYEALMRSTLPTLTSPLQILALAKLDSKLAVIEKLTWFKALEKFKYYRDKKVVLPTCKIFINSIANQILSSEQLQELEEKYGDILSNVVLEVVESEETDENLHNKKVHYIEKWNGQIALDDYGSGYNSELALLVISPNYIKIDMEIIRNIDIDINKQALVSRIIQYGHERNMKIIAEGIENSSELLEVMELKVDYVQGYYLAHPKEIPLDISKELKTLIMKHHKKG